MLDMKWCKIHSVTHFFNVFQWHTVSLKHGHRHVMNKSCFLPQKTYLHSPIPQLTYICTISKNALETLHNNCLKYSREILFHHLKLLQTIHTSTYITLLIYLDPLRLKTDFALCLCSNAMRARIRALIVRRFLDASRAWTSSWQAANSLTIPSRICTSWSIFSWMAESSSSYIQKNNFGIE